MRCEWCKGERREAVTYQLFWFCLQHFYQYLSLGQIVFGAEGSLPAAPSSKSAYSIEIGKAPYALGGGVFSRA